MNFGQDVIKRRLQGSSGALPSFKNKSNGAGGLMSALGARADNSRNFSSPTLKKGASSRGSMPTGVNPMMQKKKFQMDQRKSVY